MERKLSRGRQWGPQKTGDKGVLKRQVLESSKEIGDGGALQKQVKGELYIDIG